MNKQKSLKERKQNSTTGNGSLLKIIGGAAVVVGAVLVITSLSDIKRYIRITRM